MNKTTNKTLKTHLPLLFFCVFYVLFSLITYKDFGITTDEQREYGAANKLVELIVDKRSPEYFSNAAKHESPYISPYFRGHLAIFRVLNTNSSYETYHLLNLLFGLGVFVVMYMFLYSFTQKPLYSILGPVFLFITPRYLGHIPANPKDIPFSFFYLLGLYQLFRFYKSKSNFKISHLVQMGIVFGLAQATRIIGFSLLIIYLPIMLTKISKNKSVANISKGVLGGLVILLLSLLTMYIVIPYLWINPLLGFKTLLVNAGSFSGWDNTILFLGNTLTRNQRPDIYLPVWLAVTLPLYIIILGLYALTKVSHIIKKPQWNILLFSLFLNLAVYYFVKPVIYNGLRHFLYLIPIIVLLASMSFGMLFKEVQLHKKFHLKALLGMLLILFAITTYSTFSLHPYQSLYFNELTNGLAGAQGYFELDYWGTTYSEAAKWLEEHKAEIVTDESPKKVYVCTMEEVAKYYLGDSYRLVDKSDDADYVVCDFDRQTKRNLDIKSTFEINRQGVALLKIGVESVR